jgi:long-chain fatty acid transport protein
MEKLADNLLTDKRNMHERRWKTYVNTVCRNHPIRDLLHQDPFTRLSYSKPRGYPGDAELLDMIYGVGTTNSNCASKVGGAIHEYYLQRPAPEAVRGRRRLVARFIGRFAENCKQGSILSIAAGHLREAQLSRAIRKREFAQFVALDQDIRSLEGPKITLSRHLGHQYRKPLSLQEVAMLTCEQVSNLKTSREKVKHVSRMNVSQGGRCRGNSEGIIKLLLMVTFLLLTSLARPSTIHATGFKIVDQSASGTGQASAFTAQADDASAVFYNPAGMTQLRGVQLSLGTLLIGGSTSYTSPTGATATGDFGNSVAYPPPTNFYITANLKDLGITALGDLSAGVAVVAPFGINYSWPNNGPFNTALTSQSLELFDIKPTLAYKLNDQFSVGLGMDIYTFFNFWGEGQGETKLNSSGAPGLPPAGTPLEINGRDTALGFNASFMYTPFRNADGKPLANVGFVYRSQATLHLDGQFLVNGGVAADAHTTLVLPQVFTGGVALWPVRDKEREWKLELDVDYTGWNSIRNTDVHLSNGTTIPIPRNWNNAITIMIGTEYKWLQLERLPHWEVALRGGYWFSQTPSPDSTFSPGVPDADNNAISVGLGLLCKDKGHFFGLIPCSGGSGIFGLKGIGLDLAYQAILYEPRTVTGSMPPLTLPGTVDGRYQTTYHVGAINLRVNF